jgi:uncharacterized protein YkwD
MRTPARTLAALVAIATPCAGGPAEHATLCLINAQRQHHQLQPLKPNPRLARAARAHSREMVRGHYFSHTEPQAGSFLARMRKSGFLGSAHWWKVGENIGWGTMASASPRALVQAWMQSPPHRKQILTGAYRVVGVGVVQGVPEPSAGSGSTYTTDFGVKH